MNTYRLTETGRAMTWLEWKKKGGCGLSDWAVHYISKQLCPPARWPKTLTLGDLADASALADREIARYGHERTRLKDFAKPETLT